MFNTIMILTLVLMGLKLFFIFACFIIFFSNSSIGWNTEKCGKQFCSFQWKVSPECFLKSNKFWPSLCFLDELIEHLIEWMEIKTMVKTWENSKEKPLMFRKTVQSSTKDQSHFRKGKWLENRKVNTEWAI